MEAAMSSKQPGLISFEPDKLLKVVGRTTRQSLLKGGSGPMHPRRPAEEDIEELSIQERMARIIDMARAEEEATACGLDPANISLCSREIEAACPMRGVKSCPRRQREKASIENKLLRDESARRGVPERVLVKAFDIAPERTKSVLAVEQFLLSDRALLVLSGTNQCGKTTAAGWAACALPQLGGETRRTIYFTAAEATVPENGDALLRRLPSCQLAVLDDVGQAYFGASGFSLRQLEVIVDTVYRANKKLILCTDIELKRPDGSMPFIELIGKRITSRIHQAGRFEADLGGPFRPRPAQ